MSTEDREPYAKTAPVADNAVLRRLQGKGVVVMPSARRRPIDPVDAGGDDSTSIIADARR